MRKIKPIALKKANLLSNEEMKNLFGGSAVSMTCKFTCSNGETLSATSCTSCQAAENGGYCVRSTGSAVILICASSSTTPAPDESGTQGSGRFYA